MKEEKRKPKTLPGRIATVVAPGTVVPDETCRPARDAVIAAATEHVAALVAWNQLEKYNANARKRVHRSQRELVRAVERLQEAL